MESKRRNTWIAVVFALVVVCCIVVVIGAALAAWFFGLPSGWSPMSGVEGTPIDRTFEVGASPSLGIDNFAGSVTIRSGGQSEIRVRAIKHARRSGDLDRIEVQISEQGGRVEITTKRPPSLSSAWVELEITAPADTYLDLRTGSGSVDVDGVGSGAKIATGSGSVTTRGLSGDIDLSTGSGSINASALEGRLQVSTGSGRIAIEDMTGEIDAHTGTGSIGVSRVSGMVRLDTGSGSIEYQGSPEGDCRFETGSGSITLRLPADLGAQVDLHTGSGSMRVDFAVAGQISKRDVKGTIGGGGDVSIYVRTGSGSISLIRD